MRAVRAAINVYIFTNGYKLALIYIKNYTSLSVSCSCIIMMSIALSTALQTLSTSFGVTMLQKTRASNSAESIPSKATGPV
mmetsp:Transcript_20152/g.28692  ORF Transcript_20152/g.28692 Transcript_20152/m.28692 type:complete len:81 (-) Transcript_20152:575-817(-)